MSISPLSVVIPTLNRGQVLVDTVESLLALSPGPAEIILVDQTQVRDAATEQALQRLCDDNGTRVVRLKLPKPSIPHAMNVGLLRARSEVVLFLDDDIRPSPNLVEAHAAAHAAGHEVVVGQVLQPGERPIELPEGAPFRFSSSTPRRVETFMGGNVSMRRSLALALGGFDENFVGVAYRFENEFADRILASGRSIWFEPRASIDHLKAPSGGTRTYGHHLRSLSPAHPVGEYYYLLRSGRVRCRLLTIAWRPLRAVRTRHHATHPWWIPATLLAEAGGLAWALALFWRGPRLVDIEA